MTPGELLEPEKDYEAQILCYRLAKGNLAEMRRLYEEIPASEVYKLKAIYEADLYYSNPLKK